MTTTKRKYHDDLIFDVPKRAPSETTGCDAYLSAAVQYPFIGGSSTLGKLLIAAFVNLIPMVGGMVFAGYALRATRRVMRGDYELPDWDDFGGDLVRGLILSIGLFIYSLLLMFSMALIFTIPIAIFFAFPMYAYVVARYAETDDIASFVDIVGAYRSVLFRFGDSIMMAAGSFVTVIVFTVMIAVGMICLFVPGLMAAAGLGLAIAFNVGVYGRAALAD